MQSASTQRAYDYIRRQLMSGLLTPGTRLVNRTLADEIGVSVIPVREAISRLSSEGVVTHVSGAGFYVRRPDRQELIELYGLREALETYAAAEAARCATEPELGELEAICAAWSDVAVSLAAAGRACTPDEEGRWLDLDQRYHGVLLTAARNRWLTKAVNDLRLTTRVFGMTRRTGGLGLTAEHAADTVRTHAGLVDALRRRDPAAAQDWMREQIRRGLRRLLELLDRPPTDPAPTGDA